MPWQAFGRAMRALLAPLVALALAGCIAQPQPAPVDPQQLPAEAAAAAEELQFGDGETFISSLPVVGGEGGFAMDVPEGQRWLAQTVKWETRGSVLQFIATDPNGQEAGEYRTLAGASPRSPTRLDWWVADPIPGAWQFTVRADGSVPMVRERVTMQSHTANQVDGMHVAQRTPVNPTGFVEVNMEMKAGDRITYDWTAAAPIHFDIHTHRNGETVNLVDETADGGRAEFVAEEDGGYSLLWAQVSQDGPVPPTGGSPVELTYRIDGAFELHSAVG